MKTIIVHIEDDEGQGARLQAAYDLARATGGHLLCVSVLPYAAYALGDPAMGAFPVATIMEAVDQRRRAERTQIEAELKRQGVNWDWRACDGDGAERLAEAARLADVIIMSAGPYARQAGIRMAIAGDVALRAPAPVLAVPEGSSGFDVAGHAVIGWDGSQEAAKAMRAALPMLALASAVTLLTIDEKATDYPAARAAAFLSRHGIHAEVAERPRGNGSVEGAIRAFLSESGASWMVHGAYGHSRLRQTLFGGVTRGLLSDAPVPLLIAH
ncbi:universal stress protein [Sandarakinorhabdus sp.]|uniref:universal stress protein n=1 Tax=Sandarakinorhabdus sp. TaxID=1916663 RepID=UPI00286E81B2|nr:universal stress protein [Sandarakinorhabdus sp.]